LFKTGIEGRIAIVTDVGWNAVDANGSQGEAIIRADGEIVWSWRPRYLALKHAMMLAHHAGDGGKRDGSPGRARISRNTTAQGRPA
jgi:hypothetical protein